MMDITTGSVNTTIVNNDTTIASDKDEYDSYGAMLFIVAVIIVYGVAVICMLGFYSGREVQLEDFDKQANTFLKEVDTRRRQFDIKSRKSMFTKRLTALRSELSHDQGPSGQSHVANYLIASIGMNTAHDRPLPTTTESTLLSDIILTNTGVSSSSRSRSVSFEQRPQLTIAHGKGKTKKGCRKSPPVDHKNTSVHHVSFKTSYISLTDSKECSFSSRINEESKFSRIKKHIEANCACFFTERENLNVKPVYQTVPCAKSDTTQPIMMEHETVV